MVDQPGEKPAPAAGEIVDKRSDSERNRDIVKRNTQAKLSFLRGQLERPEKVEQGIKEISSTLLSAVDYVKSPDCTLPATTKDYISQHFIEAGFDLDDVATLQESHNNTAALERLKTISSNLKPSLGFLTLAKSSVDYVTGINNAFKNKEEQLQAQIGPLAAVEAAPVAQSNAPVVVPDAGTQTSPESVPATKEQTDLKDAITASTEASNSLLEKVNALSSQFEAKIAALQATIPAGAGILAAVRPETAEKLKSIENAKTNFSNAKKTIVDSLAKADSSIRAYNFAEAKSFIEKAKSDLDQMLEKGATQVSSLLADTSLPPERRTIITDIQTLITNAKTEFSPFFETRQTKIAAALTAKNALDEKKATPLPLDESPSLAEQQNDPESTPAVTDAATEAMTMDEFTEKLQTAWEKMGEAMEGKKWGAVLAGLVAMLGLVLTQFKSMDSLDKWGTFFEGFGEDEAEEGTEAPAEAAPEKPTTQEAVLTQLGVADATKQTEFAGLKTAEVVRFVTADGAPTAPGEPAYPQPLIDFKATQADAYGKLKTQLELNGFTAYQEGLPDADKPNKPFGDFIAYRLTSDATKAEGWKIA